MTTARMVHDTFMGWSTSLLQHSDDTCETGTLDTLRAHGILSGTLFLIGDVYMLIELDPNISSTQHLAS